MNGFVCEIDLFNAESKHYDVFHNCNAKTGKTISLVLFRCDILQLYAIKKFRNDEMLTKISNVNCKHQ